MEKRQRRPSRFSGVISPIFSLFSVVMLFGREGSRSRLRKRLRSYHRVHGEKTRGH
jgi:hypothetical protein